MANALTYQSEFTGQQMDERFTAVATLTAALEALTGVVAQKYVKPSDGIPSTDMTAAVQASLAKAESAVQSLADYYTKTEVDQLLAAINGMDYVDVATLPTASASTMGKIYLLGPDSSGYYAYYYTSYDGTSYSWVGPLGTTEISLSNYATKAELNQLDQKVTDLDNVLDTAGTREQVLATGATNNSYVNYQTGAVTSSSANKSTDGIDVSEYHGRTIQYLQNVYTGSSGSVGMAFYDSNNTFVSGVPCHFGGSAEGVEETTTIVPNNATYAKFTIFKDYADSFYVKALGDYHSERLDEIEDIVNNLIQDADTEDDFDISDDDGNIIARFLDGDVRTKNFDSSLLKSEDDADSDFSVQDEDGNIIIGVVGGYPVTKNFNGEDVENRLANLEDGNSGIEGWSKMPGLGENPLSFVRFDGGMGRIFRTWGFIGDSYNSGEMYGKQTEILSLSAEHQNTAISEGALVAETGSVVTEQYQVSAYLPRLRLVFASSSGLSGKILAASVQNEVYTNLITGGGNTTYTISLSSGRNIVISYPSDNVPQILFGSTFVQDMYDLSWGQQMARLLGSAGYNFSVGGEYCKRWCIGEDNDRRWQEAQTSLKDAYTIALGVNDRGYWLDGATSVVNYPCVTAYPNQNQYGALTITKADVLADIDLDDYTNNADSYAGWYAGIIQRIKSVRPDSHIFCITNPGEGGGEEWNQTIRLVVEIMQEKYGNTIWLIDLATYNPNTQEINANCNLNGHWSAFGYLYAAYEISTYIDWLIRNNIDAFRGSSLIGTGSSAKEWTII